MQQFTINISDTSKLPLFFELIKSLDFASFAKGMTEKQTEPILYKQSIIDAKNSKDAYVFNEAEFEYMSKQLLEDKQIDLEKYKVNS